MTSLMSTYRDTCSTTNAELIVNFYIVTGAVIAELSRTNRNTLMAVNTFFRIYRNNRFKVFHLDCLFLKL